MSNQETAWRDAAVPALRHLATDRPLPAARGRGEFCPGCWTSLGAGALFKRLGGDYHKKQGGYPIGAEV
jgi:hypothetical protein